MIGVVDYGMGNIFSLTGALKRLNIEYMLSEEIEDLKKCNALILPGVGAFPDAMENLKARKLDVFIKEWANSGKPILGICLGMQLLFSESLEHGLNIGLDLIPGSVERIPEIVKVPHMGWNNITKTNKHKFLEDYPEGYVYFVHSFYAKTSEEYILAKTLYGVEIPGIVGNGSVIGIQFHPEKSSKVGEEILKEILRKWGVFDGV